MATKFHKKILHISSREKVNQRQSSSDFNININRSTGLSKIKRVVLKQASVPNSQYNINQYNNKFTWLDSDDVGHTVDVTIGQYSLTELLTVLNDSTGFGIFGIIISQNPVNSRLLISATTPIKLINLSQGNPMAEVIGLSEPWDLTTTTVTYDLVSLPNMSGAPSYYISSHALAEAHFLTPNRSDANIIGVIQSTGSFGSYIHYSSEMASLDSVDSSSLRHGKNISDIDIKILDHKGRVINLNGLEVDLILQIFY